MCRINEREQPLHSRLGCAGLMLTGIGPLEGEQGAAEQLAHANSVWVARVKQTGKRGSGASCQAWQPMHVDGGRAT